jgi:hypothetical protein
MTMVYWYSKCVGGVTWEVGEHLGGRSM